MPSHAIGRSGTPHAGTGNHRDPRSPNPLVSYELRGEVRWLDVPLERIVLAVRDTNGHAGPFLGRDVTVDLTAARVNGGTLDELLPGTEVHVRARLTRELHDGLPGLLPAHGVTLLPA